MELPERIKGFMAGLAFGGMLPVRLKQPTEIPVEQIEISYFSDTLNLGDTMLLSCKLYPEDATHRAVDWESSDPSVASVQKINNETALLTTYATGTIDITCRSTDGYGAYAVIKVNIQQGEIFKTLAFTTHSYYLGEKPVRKTALIFNYTPITADGNKMKFRVKDPISGENTEYSIRNTAIPNIKELECKFTTDDIRHYFTRYASLQYYQDFEVEATDGSGLKTSFSIASGSGNTSCGPATTLYGSYCTTNTNSTITSTLYLMIGFTIAMGAVIDNTQCLYNDAEIEIVSGGEFIKLNKDTKEVTAIGVGEVRLIVRRSTLLRSNLNKSYVEYNFVINCIEYQNLSWSISASSALQLLNKDGDFIPADTMYTILENNNIYKIIGTRRAYKTEVESVPSEYVRLLDDGWFEMIKQPEAKISLQGYCYGYNPAVDPRVTTSNLNAALLRLENAVRVIPITTRLDIGTVASQYLDSSKKAVYVMAYMSDSGNYWRAANAYTERRIDCIYNADELRLIDTIYMSGNPTNSTLTLTSVTGTKPGTSGYPFEIYVFDKLVDRDVSVTFQLHDNNKLNSTITI